MSVGTNRTDQPAAEESRPRANRDASDRRESSVRARLRTLSSRANALWRRLVGLVALVLDTVSTPSRDNDRRASRIEPADVGPRGLGYGFHSGVDLRPDREGRPLEPPYEPRPDRDTTVSERGQIGQVPPALPAGQRELAVERTDDRFTLADPERDGAYVSSTVWTDVER